MAQIYAHEFQEISAALATHVELRERVLDLIATQPMAGKVTEGGDRLATFREILNGLVNGEISFSEAYGRTERELPRAGSIHAANNRVFPHDWSERLVRTQFSRFYNQAVMEQLLAQGETECFVPHSSQEDRGSKCSLYLAGRNNDLKTLYGRLVASYGQGQWTNDLKIPEHPHCTHVVTPVR